MRLGNNLFDPKTYDCHVNLAGIYYSITIDILINYSYTYIIYY
jgi:hypothetical protein